MRDFFLQGALGVAKHGIKCAQGDEQAVQADESFRKARLLGKRGFDEVLIDAGGDMLRHHLGIANRDGDVEGDFFVIGRAGIPGDIGALRIVFIGLYRTRRSDFEEAYQRRVGFQEAPRDGFHGRISF